MTLAIQTKKEVAVTVGGRLTAADMIARLATAGNRVTEEGRTLMERTYPGQTSMPLRLAVVKLKDLGFKHPTSRQEAIRAGIETGLGYVPLAAGPEFRLQYGDQAAGETAMLASNEGPTTYLFINFAGQLQLGTCALGEDQKMQPWHSIVFMA